MEFPFEAAKALNCDSSGYAVIDGSQQQTFAKRPSMSNSRAFGYG